MSFKAIQAHHTWPIKDLKHPWEGTQGEEPGHTIPEQSPKSQREAYLAGSTELS